MKQTHCMYEFVDSRHGLIMAVLEKLLSGDPSWALLLLGEWPSSLYLKPPNLQKLLFHQEGEEALLLRYKRAKMLSKQITNMQFLADKLQHLQRTRNMRHMAHSQFRLLKYVQILSFRGLMDKIMANRYRSDKSAKSSSKLPKVHTNVCW